MNLVERHCFKKRDAEFKELLHLLHMSKNLYNATLYETRQHYFKTKKHLRYHELVKRFAADQNPDYKALPSKVAQQTMMMVDKAYKAFFACLLAREPGQRVSIPQYKDADGYFPLFFNSQAFSPKKREGYLWLGGTGVYIKTERKARQVRVLAPAGGCIVVEVVYDIPDVKKVKDNGRYFGVDLGVNNLATVVSTTGEAPFIINGRPVKSINQYFNKKEAELQSRLKGGRKTSRRIDSITRKRNNKIKDYMHKASRMLVNHAVSSGISKIVVGHNAGWKQEAGIGRKNNQNFVLIPHWRFIHMVKYKAEMAGIEVVSREESYTSKCSFLDSEVIGRHDEYVGRRVKRGLFKSASGEILNADVNGAANILRKEAGNRVSPDSVEVRSAPAVHTVKL